MFKILLQAVLDQRKIVQEPVPPVLEPSHQEKPVEMESSKDLKLITVGTCQETYQLHSKTTGDHIRSAAFAGIAMIWVVKPNGVPMPKSLKLAGTYLFATLLTDISYYAVGTFAWGMYGFIKDRDPASANGFRANDMINWPMTGLFWIRYGLFICASVWMFKYLRYSV